MLFASLLLGQPVTKRLISEKHGRKARRCDDYLLFMVQTFIIILQYWTAGIFLFRILVLVDDITGKVFLPERKTARDA
jgi:hypothetical protein